MERQQPNNPEKYQKPKPWRLKCPQQECGKEYVLTPENSAMAHYEKQPECNFVFGTCPHCETNLRSYMSYLDPEEANKRGIKIHDDEEYAEPHIYEEWCAVKGIELLKERQLTPRLESEIEHFSETMDVIPDELLYDCITSMNTVRNMPERWID